MTKYVADRFLHYERDGVWWARIEMHGDAPVELGPFESERAAASVFDSRLLEAFVARGHAAQGAVDAVLLGAKHPSGGTPMARPKSPRTPRKAFGGYQISFAGRTETLEQIFGSEDLAPSEMTKRLWAYVKKNRLATK